MAENSKIEWCDHTFNPWEGCTKVSDGCKHCYAEARANRFGTVKWGPTGQRRRTSAANWRKPLAWNRQAKAEGRRYRVFCASLADVFEYKPDQPEMDDWRRELFQMIIDTRHLDWLLLTKRPELVNGTLRRLTGMDESSVFVRLQNVWIGTSVENQEQADKRIPELLSIPAAVRFLSMEPLLGEVDLCAVGGDAFGWGKIDALSGIQYIRAHAMEEGSEWEVNPTRKLNWVIVGGESGHDARPMHLAWARSIRDQCKEGGVPFFFKQWGEWADGTEMWHNEDLKWSGCMVRLGKSKAGRLLDGREWNEFPEN